MKGTFGPRIGCGACGSERLETILSLGTTPIANTFLADPRESAMALRYPLSMLECASCRLAQVGYVVPDDVLWADDFGYYSSTNAPLHKHFADYAQWAMKHVLPPDLAKAPIIEVGCNDGILLQHFAEAGYGTLGIDPARGPAGAARGRGLEVISEGLTQELARRIRAERGAAGLVLANNVAAHVGDLPDFLMAIRELLHFDGLLILEVQSFEHLALRHGFDMLYHEHRFFYSPSSLRRTLERFGFNVLQTMNVTTQGGSLRVVAGLGPRAGVSHGDGVMGTRSMLALGMQARADFVAGQLRDTVREMHREGLKIGLYGAPAKATTLLYWTGIASMIDHAVDTTPAKIGRYMPGTRIPIEGESNLRADVYVLGSWNYASSILRKEREFLDRGGRFLIPTPVPTVI